jgi:hypothetical protein
MPFTQIPLNQVRLCSYSRSINRNPETKKHTSAPKSSMSTSSSLGNCPRPNSQSASSKVSAASDGAASENAAYCNAPAGAPDILSGNSCIAISSCQSCIGKCRAMLCSRRCTGHFQREFLHRHFPLSKSFQGNFPVPDFRGIRILYSGRGEKRWGRFSIQPFKRLCSAFSYHSHFKGIVPYTMEFLHKTFSMSLTKAVTYNLHL